MHLLALTALGATDLDMRDTVIAFASVSARFLTPVFPGDRLTRRTEVTALEPRNEAQGWVTMQATLARGSEPVLEAEHRYLWKRRQV